MLRRASQTVEELAQALDLTDNAVRAHLAPMERDGLVQQHGRRRSSKPASLYDLTEASELVGVKVEEQCDRNEKVSCRFVVPTI